MDEPDFLVDSEKRVILAVRQNNCSVQFHVPPRPVITGETGASGFPLGCIVTQVGRRY